MLLFVVITLTLCKVHNGDLCWVSKAHSFSFLCQRWTQRHPINVSSLQFQIYQPLVQSLCVVGQYKLLPFVWTSLHAVSALLLKPSCCVTRDYHRAMQVSNLQRQIYHTHTCSKFLISWWFKCWAWSAAPSRQLFPSRRFCSTSTGRCATRIPSTISLSKSCFSRYGGMDGFPTHFFRLCFLLSLTNKAVMWFDLIHQMAGTRRSGTTRVCR